MQKSLIITVGVILILLVLGVWVYLLFFGTPNNSNDVFANLGLGEPSSEVPITLEPVEVSEPVTQLGSTEQVLRQLTTRPVAGFAFVGSSTEILRYVERGTGHVYEIDTSNDTERRISGTTIPRVVDAVFSPAGERVTLMSENGYQSAVSVGTIEEEGDSVSILKLPSGAFDSYFVTDNTLRYVVRTTAGLEGYELTVDTNQEVLLFSIPLQDVTMVWSGEDIFLYNRPSSELQGALYEVAGGKLVAETNSLYGFVGGITENYYLGSAVQNGELNSFAVERNTNKTAALPMTFIPEKCIPTETTGVILWCAAPLENLTSTSVEDWYKGTQNFKDFIWLVNIPAGEAQLSLDLFGESGRLIDVAGIAANADSSNLLFKNKIDGTLWLYDTRL